MNTLADKDKIEVCTINPTVVIAPYQMTWEDLIWPLENY